MDKETVEVQLKQLMALIDASDLYAFEDTNIPSYRTIWGLWNDYEQVGQIEARFGSPYSDEPDGYAAYLIGHNWTEYLPTVEACAKQLQERAWDQYLSS